MELRFPVSTTPVVDSMALRRHVSTTPVVDSMDLVLEGNLLLPQGLVRGAVGISGGRIAAIAKNLRCERSLDFGDKLLLPAGIDAHVHLREPGLGHKETVETGTIAAACGGITTVAEMPNTLPPATTPSNLEEKARIYERRAAVDVLLYAGLVPETTPVRIAAMARTASGFKVYLAPSTGGLLVENDADIGRFILELVKNDFAGPLAVHAEAPGEKRRIASLRDYSLYRSPAGEAAAVKRVLVAAAKAPASDPPLKVHLCHLSTPLSLEAGECKAAGAIFTREVAPHHLLLNHEAHATLGPCGLVNPPLRSAKEQARLLEMFIAGEIDVMASDHAPHLPEEKEEGFGAAPAGLPGVETMLPLMFSRVRHGALSLETLMKAAAVNPAALFCLNSGRLEVGLEANLILVDLRKERKIRGKALHSKCGWTPYEGWDAVFPRRVWLRGEEIVTDGEPVAESLGRIGKQGVKR